MTMETPVMLVAVDSISNSTLTTQEEIAAADAAGSDSVAFVSHIPNGGSKIMTRFLESSETQTPEDSKIMKRFQENEEKNPSRDALEEDQNKSDRALFDDDVDDDDQSENTRGTNSNAEAQTQQNDAGAELLENDFDNFGFSFASSQDEDDESVSTEGELPMSDEDEESLSDADSFLSDEDDELNLFGNGSQTGLREFENVFDGALFKTGIISGKPGENDLLDQTGAAVDTLVRRLTSLSIQGPGQKRRKLKSNKSGSRKTKETTTLFSRIAASKGPPKSRNSGKKTRIGGQKKVKKGFALKRFQKHLFPENKLAHESSAEKTVGINSSFSSESDNLLKTKTKTHNQTMNDQDRFRDGLPEGSDVEESNGCGICFHPEELVELFPMATMGLNGSTSNDDHDNGIDCERACATKSFDDANDLLGSALDTMKNQPHVVGFREQFIAPCSPVGVGGGGDGDGDDDDDTVPKDIQICHPESSPSERISKLLKHTRTSSTTNITIDTCNEGKNDDDVDEKQEEGFRTDPRDGTDSILDEAFRDKEPQSDSRAFSSDCPKIDSFSAAKNIAIRKVRSARSYLDCGGENSLMSCMDDVEMQVVKSQKPMPLSARDHQAMPGVGATIPRKDESGFVDPAMQQAEAKNLAMSVNRTRFPIKKIGLAAAPKGAKALHKFHRLLPKTAPGTTVNNLSLGMTKDGEEDEEDEDTIIIQEEVASIIINGIVEDRSRSFPFDEQSNPNNIVGDVLCEDTLTSNAPSVRVFNGDAEETDTSLTESNNSPGEFAPTTRVDEDTLVFSVSMRETIEHAEKIISTSVYGLEAASPSGGDVIVAIGGCNDEINHDTASTNRPENVDDFQQMCTIELTDDQAIELTHPTTTPEPPVAAASQNAEREDTASIATGIPVNNEDDSVRATPVTDSNPRRAKKKRSLWKLQRRPKLGIKQTTSSPPPPAPDRPVSDMILIKDGDFEVAQTSSHHQEIATTVDDTKDKISVMKRNSRMAQKLRRMPSLKRRKSNKQTMLRTEAVLVPAPVPPPLSSKPIHKVLAVNETGCEILIR